MMSSRFRGRVAVVTGGASGIGRAIVRAFAKARLRVAVVDVDAASAEALSREICAEGGEAISLGCDVSRFGEVEAVASAVRERFGPVAVLCNNAGIGGGIGAHSSELDVDDWERVLAVNLRGVIHGVRAFVPRMIEASEGGHLVNTASMASFLPAAGTAPYTTTKFAILGLSEVLRAELAPHGIGVSALCPGPFQTGIWGTDETSAMGGDPAVLGPRVLAAIEEDEPFIFTHAEFAPLVSDRFEQILASLRGAETAMQRADQVLKR